MRPILLATTLGSERAMEEAGAQTDARTHGSSYRLDLRNFRPMPTEDDNAHHSLDDPLSPSYAKASPPNGRRGSKTLSHKPVADHFVLYPSVLFFYCLLLVVIAYVFILSDSADAFLNSIHYIRDVPGQKVGYIFVRDPNLDHPIKDQTVPSSQLHIVILSGGITLVLCEMLFACSIENVLRALATWMQATILDEVLTNLAKYYVGALRPNFYAGCGWDDERMACTSEWYTQFRKSFPSGHSSHSACFAALVTLHLMRHVAMLDAKGSWMTMRLLQLLLLVPAPIALFIASSRVHDDWHHPADVVAGAALGTGVAALTHWLFWNRSEFMSSRGYAPLSESEPLV